MLASPLPAILPTSPPRKRTSSFSCPTPSFPPNPRPAKVSRTTPRANTSSMSSLRRTESFLTLPIQTSASASSQPSTSSSVPYNRSLRYYKEQRDRRKALASRSAPTHPQEHQQQQITFRTQLEVQYSNPSPRVPLPQLSKARINPSLFPPRRQIQPSLACPCPSPPAALPGTRTTSPLSPQRSTLPPRPSFPRSKPEADLYKAAITARMRSSPEGQKILHMGPRLAVSIMTATRELEKIVAAQAERERDLAMVVDSADVAQTAVESSAQGGMGNSWVFVPGEDWEMIDCGA